MSIFCRKWKDKYHDQLRETLELTRLSDKQQQIIRDLRAELEKQKEYVRLVKQSIVFRQIYDLQLEARKEGKSPEYVYLPREDEAQLHADLGVGYLGGRDPNSIKLILGMRIKTTSGGMRVE